MDDVLLSYYNRELAYLRKLGAEFAERHPKIAGRLRLDKDMVEDPHVARLIEAVAFLTARIRHKLDDGFPELTEALMGVLYPDYHAPIPSLSIVRIQTIPERPEPRSVPRGTLLLTQSNPLGTCYYRTCYDTEVYPLTVASSEFSALPFKAPEVPRQHGVNQAVLRIRLRCEPGIRLAELAPAQLRFFLNGQPQLSFRLYEFLLQHATAIAIADPAHERPTVFLPPQRLRPCGMDESEAALPGDGRTSSAHRLLTEYFAFPEKFLFVRLEGLTDVWHGAGEQAEIYIYFNRSHPELVQGISGDTLLLGCTPVINLFEQRLEYIAAADLGYETKLRVDATQTRYAEIHTLLRVHARDSAGRRIELQPFYGSHRAAQGESDSPLYWHARREASEWYDGRASRGSELWLSLVDRDFRITAPDSDWIIGGDALCTNRDLPDKLPFGPGEPRLRFEQGGAGLQASCVTAPTPTVRPRLGDATRWQLITQLSLQHFSGADGLAVLKETLGLYDFRQQPETRAIIEGIVDLKTSLATARVARDGRASICQGTRLELELDELYYSGAGLYLFSAVLSEFFAHHCTVNTFVQLDVRVRQRPGSVISWPPRGGTQPLI